MEITKLALQTRNPNRVNLYVDGKFYRGLDKLVAIKLGLKPGLTLTPVLLGQLEKNQTSHTAWEWALRSLQRSPKSVLTMRRKLSDRFDATTVDQTIERLISAKLLDDTIFANRLVDHYVAGDRHSRRQIWALLKTKYLPDPVIKAALAQIDQSDESRAAAELVRRKQRQWQDRPERERYQKIAGYLSQRGFPVAVIKQTLTRELLETEDTS